jgi:serine/threonine protein phosphatase PrpC
MELISWAQTDLGSRQDMEDVCFGDPRQGLYVIADGAGGALAGKAAAETLVSCVRESMHHLSPAGTLPEGVDQNRVIQSIRAALCHGCERIYSMGNGDERLRGMSTTGIVLQFFDQQVALGHVGDSRAYLVRNAKLYQLTEDHTLLQQMRNLGTVSDDHLKAMGRHGMALQRALGKKPTVDVDVSAFDVAPNDVFLLCTDGLHKYVGSDAILDTVANLPPRDAANALVEQAKRAGTQDNVGVVVIRAADGGGHRRGMRTEEKMAVVSDVFLLRGLSVAQTLRVMTIANEVHADDGQLLCVEGEAGEELFIVLNGEVRITKAGVELSRVGPGHHFGDLALLSDGVRTATAITNGRTRLLAFKRQEFYDLLASDRELGFQLLWRFAQNMAMRLRQQSTDLVRTTLTGGIRKPNL